MLILTLGAGISSFRAVSRLEEDFDHFAERAAKRDALASQIRTFAAEMASTDRAILIRGMLQSQELVARHKSEFDALAAQMDERLRAIGKLLDDDQARAAIQRVAGEIATAKSAHYELTRSLEAQQADQAIRLYDEKIIPSADRVSQQTSAFLDANSAAAASARAEAQSRSASMRWLEILLSLVSAVAGAAVVWVVRGSTKELQVITSEINTRADHVAEAAVQVSNASHQLAQGASTQAASLDRTSASSEEIASMTSRNRDNAVSAAALATRADGKITEANSTLDEMVKSMSEISSASDQISKIIKVIDEIAFQTNILALNAAVEAARAGEAGMGFAVVADEVRNLAQRCAQAARDTTGLIENSIAKTSEGTAKLDRVASAIRGVTQTSKEITTLMEEVKLGSEEQTRGFDQISRSIVQIQQVTQQSAANAEESASAGQDMSSQAEALRSIMKRLQEMVGASEAVSVARSDSSDEV